MKTAILGFTAAMMLTPLAQALEVGETILVPREKISCKDFRFTPPCRYYCVPDEPRAPISAIEVQVNVAVGAAPKLSGIKQYASCADLAAKLGDSATVPLVLENKTEELWSGGRVHESVKLSFAGASLWVAGEGER